MRLCKVNDLKGTEVLAKDAMTLEYKILLSAGTLLKPEYIEKLKLNVVYFFYDFFFLQYICNNRIRCLA